MRRLKRKAIDKGTDLVLYSALLIVLTSLFVSCEDEEDGLTLEVATEQLVFAKEGGEDSFVIHCSGNWRINVVPSEATGTEATNDWFTMNALSGSGDGTVMVTVRENDIQSGSSRRAKVAVVCGAQSDTLIVSQQGITDGLIVTETSYTVTAEEQVLSIALKVSGNFAVRKDQLPFWITQTDKPEVGAGTRAYEEDTVYLGIAANYAEERVGQVKLSGSTMSLVLTVTQEEGEMPEAKVVKGANCYMVQPGETVEINLDRVRYFWNNAEYGDPEKGVGNETEWEVSLLWQDAKNAVAGFLTDAGSVEKTLSGTGINDVSSFKVKAGSAEGNAVVAIRPKGTTDEPGNYLWSWHIWVTAYNPNSTTLIPETGKYFYPVASGEVHRYGGDEWQAGKYANTFVMDRNLGARSAEWNLTEAGGEPKADIMQGVLYYQWGRKDPFGNLMILYDIDGNKLTAKNPKNVASRQWKQKKISITESVLNPTGLYLNESDSWCTQTTGNMDTNPWNSFEIDPNVKSIFDPCPAGWKLPDRDVLGSPQISYKNQEENVSAVNSSFYFGLDDHKVNRVYYYPSGTIKGGQVFLPVVGKIDIYYEEPFYIGQMTGIHSNKRKNIKTCYACLIAEDWYPLTDTKNISSGEAAMSTGYPVRCIKETD